MPESGKIPTFDELLAKVAKAAEATPPESPDLSGPASTNPAVARCCQAYARALEAAKENGKSRYAAEKDAERAFRNAMPPLSGAQNIRDFIACVTQAMLLEAILFADGTRLLYAAQVAYSTVETRSHHSPRKTSSRPNSRKEQPEKHSQTAP